MGLNAAFVSVPVPSSGLQVKRVDHFLKGRPWSYPEWGSSSPSKTKTLSGSRHEIAIGVVPAILAFTVSRRRRKASLKNHRIFLSATSLLEDQIEALDEVDDFQEEDEAEAPVERRGRTFALWPGIQDPLEDFGGLPIPVRLKNAFTRRGIIKPAPIQEAVMPKLKNGEHIIIQSPTGGGKTLAYLLPVLARLQPTMHVGAQVLLLVPTPELALQITREIRWLVEVLAGEEGVCWFNPQVPHKLACEVLLSRSCLWRAMRKDTAIIVTTPSIIISELKQLRWESKKFGVTMAYFMGSNIHTVIMDEVDELCPYIKIYRAKTKLGAAEEVLDYVFDVVRTRYRNRDVQMISASATASPEKVFRVFERLMEHKYAKRRDVKKRVAPQLIKVSEVADVGVAAGPGEIRRSVAKLLVPASIDHNLALLDEDDQNDIHSIMRMNLAVKIVERLRGTVMIFVPEHVKMDAVVIKLKEAGVDSSKYRSSIGLGQDTAELADEDLEDTRSVRKHRKRSAPPAEQDLTSEKAFEKSEALYSDLSSGKYRVLVAKMSAGRGIDLQDIRYVVMLGFPESAKHYLHLAGRTGRMGRPGTVITIASPLENRELAFNFEERLNINFQTWDITENKSIPREKPPRPDLAVEELEVDDAFNDE